MRFPISSRTFLSLALAALALLGAAHTSVAAESPVSDHTLLMQIAARLSADESTIAQLKGQLAARTNAAAPPAAASTTTYGPFTVTGKDVYLTGYNLHIQSGSGSTTGTVNGYGNLIIGYNEAPSSPKRTGSHNLIIGPQNNYTSYGGIVGGAYNTVSGAYSSVLSGRQNTASYEYTGILGGYHNAAGAEYSTVSGGDNDSVSSGGTYAAIGGGENVSTATEYAFVPEQTDFSSLATQVSTIKQSETNTSTSLGYLQGVLAPISTQYVTRVGNDGNNHSGYVVTFTDADVQVVNGLGATDGEPNNHEDVTNYVTNGFGNLVIGYNETQASLGQGATDTRTGSHNLILGDYNEYSGFGGMVGASFNTMSGAYSSVISGGFNDAGSADTAILGGEYNSTNAGFYATVSGGTDNYARGQSSAIAGGSGQHGRRRVRHHPGRLRKHDERQ